MRKQALRYGTLIVLFALFESTIGCCWNIPFRKFIYVQQEKYTPSLGEGFSQYQGRAVYFASVVNRAENTSIWYYWSPYYFHWYEAWPTLESYFWYCLQKAFIVCGMKVYNEDEKPPAGVPELDITLLSMNERVFHFRVGLSGTGASFSRDYTISEPPPEKTDKKHLEDRAYRMIDKMIRTVLLDEDFSQAFLGASKAR